MHNVQVSIIAGTMEEL